MSKTIDALYDGEVLRPAEPLSIAPNTLVRITIESVPEEAATLRSFFDSVIELNLEGPPDWAENFDRYLYGSEPIKNGD